MSSVRNDEMEISGGFGPSSPPQSSDDKDVLIAQLRAQNKEFRVLIANLQKQLAEQREQSERQHHELVRLIRDQETPSQILNSLAGSSDPPRETGVSCIRDGETPRIHDSMREEFPLLPGRAPQRTAAKRRIADDSEEEAETTKANTAAASKKPNLTADPTPTGKTDASATVTAKKIPPIILREKQSWAKVSRRLAELKINFNKARMVRDGIAIEPTTPDDFRKAIRLLSTEKYEYHTYSLPEERHLRVVIRGLPSDLSTGEIKEDLEDQGYKPESVQRMKSRRTKAEMPLVLVLVPTNQEDILKVTRCCHLVVRVERQRAAQVASQCHRCQRYGHSQGKCTAQPRCVKCGANHPSASCEKKREEPAKCANCQGAHPASYRGCPKAPKKKAVTPDQEQRRTPASKKTAPGPSKTVEAGRSFAQAATQMQGQSQQTATTGMAEALAQMQQMCAAMSAFFAKMPFAMKT